MKHCVTGLIRLLVGLTLAGSAAMACQAETAGSGQAYLILPETKSPDGRYAVGWGLSKHPELWTEVCQWEREHPSEKELTGEESKRADELFEKVGAVAGEVENYLVDLRGEKIIHGLANPGATADRSREPNYYFAAGHRPNRHHLEVVWSRGGNLVLVNHTYRWDCVTFCAVPLFGGRTGPELDLNKQLGEATRTLVAKTSADFSGSRSDLNVAFSDLKQGSENRFLVHADAVVGKEWSSDGADIEFALAPWRKTMTAKVLAIHVSRGK